MANAILRDVIVVKNSSATHKYQTLNSKNCTDNHITNSTKIIINNSSKKTTHRLAKIICSCISHSTESIADSSLRYQDKQKLLPATNNTQTNIEALNDETLDFCNSYSSLEECLCSVCPREIYKFRTIESFSNLNISSSTAFDNTSSEEVSDAELFQTPRKLSSANLRALGVLQEKRSPLFGPPLNTPSKGVSLRSQKPLYLQRVLTTEDLISSKSKSKSTKKFKKNIDFTATEAISMNGGGKQLNNGPLGTFSKSNTSVGNGGTDINRNNGMPRNWVSSFIKKIILIISIKIRI